MSSGFNEQSFENALVSLCEQSLGYTHVCGYDVERDYRSCFYEDELKESLLRINPAVPEEGIDEAIFEIRSRLSGSVVHKNVKFTGYLQNGVDVRFMHDGEIKSDIVYLVDY